MEKSELVTYLAHKKSRKTYWIIYKVHLRSISSTMLLKNENDSKSLLLLKIALCFGFRMIKHLSARSTKASGGFLFGTVLHNKIPIPMKESDEVSSI